MKKQESPGASRGEHVKIMARYSDICRQHWVHVACPNPLLEAFIKRPIKRAAEGG